MGDPDRGGAMRYFGMRILIEDGVPGVVPDDLPSFMELLKPAY